MTATGTVDRYARLTHMIATDQCVILDGANGTELIKVRGGPPEVEEQVWGLTALLDAPDERARDQLGFEQAKADWKAGRFPKVPGDELEFIPLPE